MQCRLLMMMVVPRKEFSGPWFGFYFSLSSSQRIAGTALPKHPCSVKNGSYESYYYVWGSVSSPVSVALGRLPTCMHFSFYDFVEILACKQSEHRMIMISRMSRTPRKDTTLLNESVYSSSVSWSRTSQIAFFLIYFVACSV